MMQEWDYFLVGLMTLLVLPPTFGVNFILYRYQRRVFKSLNLQTRSAFWTGTI